MTVNRNARTEELDYVTIRCALTNERGGKFTKELSFYVGLAAELGIPKIAEEVVMSFNDNSEFYVRLDDISLNQSELLFFGVPGPSSEKVNLILELVNVDKLKDVWKFSEGEKIKHAMTCKSHGNSLMKESNFCRALRAYRLGIGCLDGSVSVKPAKHLSKFQPSVEARNLFVNLLTNAALCILKITSTSGCVFAKSSHQPVSNEMLLRHCINFCNKSLDVEPDNAKALYRMGQAYAQQNQYTEAISSAEKAVEVLKSKGEGTGIVEKSIAIWKKEVATLKREKYEQVRSAFLKRATELRDQGRLFSDNGSKDANRLHFEDWSNSLADDVMSIEEELEAFGEKMPARKLPSSKHSTGRKKPFKGHAVSLEKIDSCDEELVEEDESGDIESEN